MIGASGEGATPGVSTAGPPGPSHPPQSKLPQATTTSGICPFNNLARWRRRERRYSGGCCARDIVGGRGHPSADQTVLFPPMVSGSPPPGARWWTLSGSRVVVDCVKVPGLAVRGSLGTTTAAILRWDRCTTAHRPPSHSGFPREGGWRPGPARVVKAHAAPCQAPPRSHRCCLGRTRG